MKLSIPGVYAAPRTLANGRVKTYYYHRATGIRLPDDPTTTAFLEQVALLNRLVEQDPEGARAAAKRGRTGLTKTVEPVAVTEPAASPARASAEVNLSRAARQSRHGRA